MTVAEHKRKWLSDRIAELHTSGLKDAAIARRMGISKSYFSTVKHGDGPGDDFIDLMCKTFSFRFTLSGKDQVNSDDTNATNSGGSEDDRILEELKRMQQALNAMHAAITALTAAVLRVAKE